MRPIEVVRKLCPKARQSYLEAFENGDVLFAKAGITTPVRLAHFLAQVCHETGGLSIEWESGAYSAKRLMEIFGVGNHSAKITEAEAAKLAHNGPAIFERVYGLGNPSKAKELGNTQPGDGWKYRGGGLMQTTGRANYRRMGQKTGIDFEGHPELVVSAEHALKPALAEWTEGNLNAKADADDLRAITKRINGGYNGLADREEWLAKAKAAIGHVTLKPASKPLPSPPEPVPPPDVEPVEKPNAENTKPATNSSTVWVQIGSIIAAIGGALSDWKVAAVIGVVGLAGLTIWLRLKKPDIKGWF